MSLGLKIPVWLFLYSLSNPPTLAPAPLAQCPKGNAAFSRAGQQEISLTTTRLGASTNYHPAWWFARRTAVSLWDIVLRGSRLCQKNDPHKAELSIGLISVKPMAEVLTKLEISFFFFHMYLSGFW
jgi:hypothetical protein